MCTARGGLPLRRSPPLMLVTQPASHDTTSAAPRLFHAGELALQHGAGNLGVFDRKDAAKAAAFLRVGQLDKLCALRTGQ